MNKLREFFIPLYRSTVFPWLLTFVIGCLAVPQNGGQLELPRMLTMRAMAEHQTFQIGRYLDWTDEWARTPDGRYYNNRAPGPVLLPFPLYWPVDRLLKLTEKDKIDVKGRRPWPGRLLRSGLSFVLQILPLCMLVWLASLWLLTHGASRPAVHFFALAALWGNTASIFMNNWSGHGFTACFVFAALFALLQKKWVWFGFTLGSALLCDYVVATLFLPFLGLLLWRDRPQGKMLGQVLIGAFIPAVLWCWYHYVAFGGIFTVANKYQNPMYVDVKEQGNYLGIFRSLPTPAIAWKLLFGVERGVIFTQAWLLVGLPFGIYLWLRNKLQKEQVQLLLFSTVGFLILLMLNSAYGGWFAGNTAGPRYLSSIFIPCAFAIAFLYDKFPKWMQYTTWIALGSALFFRAMVFAINPMAPLAPLWKYHWLQIVEQEKFSNWGRFILCLVLYGIAAFWVWRRQNRTEANA